MEQKIEVYCSENSVVNISSQPKKYIKENYARYFSEEMLGLAVDKTLSGNDLRVLLGILANLEFNNILKISQQGLSDQLDIHRSDIAKSLKKLVKRGYLEIVDTIGRQNIYMFNPSVVFKSRASNLKDLKRAWEKHTLPNFQSMPVDLEYDLEDDLEEKLDSKVKQLSEKFGITQSKVRNMLLSLINEGLSSEEINNFELPY